MLELNPLHKKALTFAMNSQRIKQIGQIAVVGGTIGVLVTLSTAQQALANFEQEALVLKDFKDSNKPAVDIKLQETKLVAMFGELVNGFTGGTLGEFVDATLLYQVYKRLLPVLAQGQ